MNATSNLNSPTSPIRPLSSSYSEPIDVSIQTQHTYISISQSNRAVTLLKRLHGTTSQYRSSEQRQAIETSIFTNQCQLVVMKTGGGKTSIILLYSIENSHLKTVVIVPTRSLQKQLLDVARSCGIQSSSPKLKNDSSHFVVVTPEHLLKTKKKELLATLIGLKMLGRIFIDEVHVFHTDSDFRPFLRNLSSLSYFDIPITLLTASAPNHIISDCLENLFVGRRPLVIRQETNRFNITYECFDSGDPLQKMISEIQTVSQKLQSGEKIIVFVISITDLNMIAQMLRDILDSTMTTIYHSDLGEKEREENQNLFLSTASIMLATTAFSMGIDSPAVRFVAMYKPCFSMEYYIQQSGRAGRDQKPARASIFYNSRHFANQLLNTPTEKGQNELRLVHNYLLMSSICRRRFLSHYFDDKEITCQDQSCEQCDCCLVPCRIEDVVSYPTVLPSLSIQENSNATISSNATFVKLLQDYCVDMFKSGCFICYFKATEWRNHTTASCSNRQYGECYTCFTLSSPPHYSAACPFKGICPPDCCSHCFLPIASRFHIQLGTIYQIGNRCKNTWNILKHFWLLSLKHNPTLFHESTIFTKSKRFSDYLVLHEKFVNFIEEKSRVKS